MDNIIKFIYKQLEDKKINESQFHYILEIDDDKKVIERIKEICYNDFSYYIENTVKKEQNKEYILSELRDKIKIIEKNINDIKKSKEIIMNKDIYMDYINIYKQFKMYPENLNYYNKLKKIENDDNIKIYKKYENDEKLLLNDMLIINSQLYDFDVE